MPVLKNRIIPGNAFNLIKELPGECVNFILTDPPFYTIADVGVPGCYISDLFHDLYRVLKPDSFFVTGITNQLLPVLFYNNPFKYLWQMVLYLPGSVFINRLGFKRHTASYVFMKGSPQVNKPCSDTWVWKGKYDCQLAQEHPEITSQMIEDIIEMFTKPGDLVFDPFMGGGTIAVAAVKTGRKYLGFEMDPKWIKLASERIKFQEKLSKSFSENSKELKDGNYK